PRSGPPPGPPPPPPRGGRVEGWVFGGCPPGFVDDRRILVAAAEEPWAGEAARLLLDGRTLRPLADVA
ncbi:hypothetical protein AB0O51_38320, partial [Streptomyces sp. NPDC090301]|uniref:hypothetical protein n=1 Tax=Streptomyces sp. NPDC090301 TaxID=3154975 RepID=UPI0034338F81